MAAQVRVLEQSRYKRASPQAGAKSKERRDSILYPLSSKLLKPGTLVFENSEIEIISSPKYVSRGGDKLESALKNWGVSVENRVCLDIGASTGGFTDCLLQRGAKKVYAVDVGYGQIHPKLRNDPRVCLFEETHILKWIPPWEKKVESEKWKVKGKNLNLESSIFKSEFPLPCLVTIDVSFISLVKVLPKVAELLTPFSFPLSKGEYKGVEILALIKPQFEVEEKKYLEKGIVKNEKARSQTIQKVLGFAQSLNFKVIGHFSCPVLGAKGNREEWGYLKL